MARWAAPRMEQRQAGMPLCGRGLCQHDTGALWQSTTMAGLWPPLSLMCSSRALLLPRVVSAPTSACVCEWVGKHASHMTCVVACLADVGRVADDEALFVPKSRLLVKMKDGATETDRQRVVNGLRNTLQSDLQRVENTAELLESTEVANLGLQ